MISDETVQPPISTSCFTTEGLVPNCHSEKRLEEEGGSPVSGFCPGLRIEISYKIPLSPPRRPHFHGGGPHPAGHSDSASLPVSSSTTSYYRGLFCEFPEDSHFLRSGLLDCLIFSPPKCWSVSWGRPRPPYRGALTPPAPRFCSAQICPRVLPVLLSRWQVPPREIPRSKSIIRADPLLLSPCPIDPFV